MCLNLAVLGAEIDGSSGFSVAVNCDFFFYSSFIYALKVCCRNHADACTCRVVAGGFLGFSGVLLLSVYSLSPI
jgi:hypothetical protein